MAAPTAKAAPNPPSAAPKNSDPTKSDGSAAPTAPENKKDTRVKYPVPETGLTAWPADFDPKKHKGLGRGDFADETVFLEHKAAEYETRAKTIREEIEDIKKNGPGGKNKAAKLAKVQSELDTLVQMLKAQGHDVDAMVAAYKAKQAAAV